MPGQAAGPGEVGGGHAGLAAGCHRLALLDLLTSADLRVGVTEASSEVTAAADWRGGRLAPGTRDARHSSRGRCCCCCGGGHSLAVVVAVGLLDAGAGGGGGDVGVLEAHPGVGAGVSVGRVVLPIPGTQVRVYRAIVLGEINNMITQLSLIIHNTLISTGRCPSLGDRLGEELFSRDRR